MATFSPAREWPDLTLHNSRRAGADTEAAGLKHFSPLNAFIFNLCEYEEHVPTPS